MFRNTRDLSRPASMAPVARGTVEGGRLVGPEPPPAVARAKAWVGVRGLRAILCA